MNIKLDENLPTDLSAVLKDFGHHVDTSPQEGLGGRPDTEVWQAVLQSGRFFITQDMDFSDIRQFAPGTHPGIVLLRLDEPSRRVLTKRMRRILESVNIETWRGCFVVVTDHKIRVRRPREE